MTTHLLDHGVNYRTAPSGFVAADKHPVLGAQLRRTNGVFGVVVVELDLAVVEAGFEVWELVVGVVQRFPKLAFGKDTAFGPEMVNEFFEMTVVAMGLKPTLSLAFQGACSACSKLAFDTVNFSNLIEDPGGVSGVVVAGFGEFSPDVSEAAHGDDVEVFCLPLTFVSHLRALYPEEFKPKRRLHIP